MPHTQGVTHIMAARLFAYINRLTPQLAIALLKYQTMYTSISPAAIIYATHAYRLLSSERAALKTLLCNPGDVSFTSRRKSSRTTIDGRAAGISTPPAVVNSPSQGLNSRRNGCPPRHTVSATPVVTNGHQGRGCRVSNGTNSVPLP